LTTVGSPDNKLYKLKNLAAAMLEGMSQRKAKQRT